MLACPQLQPEAFIRLYRLLPSITELRRDDDPLVLVFIRPICIRLHEMSTIFNRINLDFLTIFLNDLRN